MTEVDDMTIEQMIKGEQLQQILEAALLAAGEPLSLAQLAALFVDGCQEVSRLAGLAVILADADHTRPAAIDDEIGVAVIGLDGDSPG